ncbi:hypothetical protein JW613_13030 [Streptomyces smyrnaeus]|uniref:Uncharacterized protein n=1 Tax=Streptomyces smyrnaeus TaxID=1387713 RepID=A0ABS3XV83_9ACTN|nr:hypothetical protein [Streptomyces smyrnaeus]
MIGRPLNGRQVALDPAQEQNGSWGGLHSPHAPPRDRPAYLRDSAGRWIWQGEPWPEDTNDT